MTDAEAAPLRAWARLRRNRLAMASMVLLALMALACGFGPLLLPHAYDRVFPDYVKVAPALAAHPVQAELDAALERISARLHARITARSLTGDVLHLTLEAPRPLDERLLAYFQRSDLFGTAQVVERQDDGRQLVVNVPLRYETFVFGTDGNGRDLLTRSLVAGRVSLAVGLLASGVALLIGVAYGAVAGFVGGRIDAVMMRLVDVLYALPFIFFVILLVVFFGRHFALVFAAIGAIEWLDMARIVRGQTLSLKRQEFVEAAQALGATTPRVLLHHIIPNLATPVIVYLTLLVPKIILVESFLSFLGLGIQEPLTSWGMLIAEGTRNIQGAPFLLIVPAGFLMLTLFALNFVGDGLRDAFDPKDR